jgi:pyridoxamine 5'-phosphate oxidase
VTDSRARPLHEQELDPDPLRHFEAWFAEALAAGEPMPEAVALATATPDGRPSVRMVLAKSTGPTGFVFYTNYRSRKGLELAANPYAALCFSWHSLGRQARIEGSVARIADAESEAYFGSRPIGSRLSASISPQSEVVEGREELERAVAELRSRLGDGEPPRPADWGGFRLEPETYEFWQHRDDRLHDRFRYRRVDDGWLVERLAP